MANDSITPKYDSSLKKPFVFAKDLSVVAPKGFFPGVDSIGCLFLKLTEMVGGLGGDMLSHIRSWSRYTYLESVFSAHLRLRKGSCVVVREINTTPCSEKPKLPWPPSWGSHHPTNLLQVLDGLVMVPPQLFNLSNFLIQTDQIWWPITLSGHNTTNCLFKVCQSHQVQPADGQGGSTIKGANM